MKKVSFPPIGNRILKSAAGVMLCWIVYFLRGKEGIPFYSMLAVLWCIQPYREGTLKMALQRTVGTVIGALYGLLTILLEIYLMQVYDTLTGYFIIALMIIPVIYTTVVLNKRNASYFSCVVFLSVTVIHLGDANPFLFVMNRVVDTFIGIAAGIAVNYARMPRRRIRSVLFAAELDDMLTAVNEHLTPYSKVEMNRMLADGANFTLSTMRTPGAIMGIISDIKLKLPVIVMNGAALYDINENSYVMAYIISNESRDEVRKMAAEFKVNVFTNALCDDNLIIYYDYLRNEAEQSIYSSLKKSPYRCYVNRTPGADDRAIYLMMIDKSEKIESFCGALREKLDSQLKIITYPSNDYPGFSYIKIYNKNSGREHLLEYICQKYNIDESVRLRAEDDDNRNLNKIAHELKKHYEPLMLPRFGKKGRKSTKV